MNKLLEIIHSYLSTCKGTDFLDVELYPKPISELEIGYRLTKRGDKIIPTYNIIDFSYISVIYQSTPKLDELVSSLEGCLNIMDDLNRKIVNLAKDIFEKTGKNYSELYKSKKIGYDLVFPAIVYTEKISDTRITMRIPEQNPRKFKGEYHHGVQINLSCV